jgi:predicted nucleotide-binding protein (sugar kinase/HSP70/actin superfamily)
MNKAVVGIPRALVYWKEPLGEFWKILLQELGYEVLLSPGTNRDIVAQGVKISDQESCFACKVFWGHTLWLDGKVDFIFVPRLIKRQDGLEYCPKFFALPDLAKLFVTTPIIAPWVDLNKKQINQIVTKTFCEFKFRKSKIKNAVQSGLEAVEKEKEKRKRETEGKIHSSDRKIALVSHPYNLYDDFVNMEIRKRLEDLGTTPLCVDTLPPVAPDNLHADRDNDNLLPYWHWEFADEIMREIRYALSLDLAGAVEISSFPCGCDAVLKEFVEREFKRHNIPFLYIIIDEHSGEAGLQTRLEAFIDTLH